MKNIEYIITKTAKDLNIDKKDCKEVIDFYWSTVYKKLTKMDCTTLFIRNLGVFTVSGFKLRIAIKDFISRLRSTRKIKKEFPEIEKKKMVEKYTHRLKTSLIQRNILAKHKFEKQNGTNKSDRRLSWFS